MIKLYNQQIVFSGLLFVILILTSADSTLAAFIIQSQEAVTIELKGYNGLTDIILFEGELDANTEHQILTPYLGLALLIFKKGQRYPVIIGDEPFILKITDPAKPPSFSGDGENEFFYKLLSGNAPKSTQYPFSRLMMQAKQLFK